MPMDPTNPEQWADYLGIYPQIIYGEIQKWSLYRLKEVLLKMMVDQAIEYDSTHWGIDVPAKRKTLLNPTFG